jgi:hypothetical protein
VADTLSQMLDPIKQSGVLEQTMDATFFFLQLVWLNEFPNTSLLENLKFTIAKSKKKH